MYLLNFAADIINIKKLMNKETNKDDMNLMFSIMINATVNNIENPNVQQLLNDPKETFEVVISEWMFSELYSG